MILRKSTNISAKLGIDENLTCLSYLGGNRYKWPQPCQIQYFIVWICIIARNKEFYFQFWENLACFSNWEGDCIWPPI